MRTRGTRASRCSSGASSSPPARARYFAFLGARQAYGSALLPPLFIAMSFAWGLAAFLIVQAAMYAWNGRTLPPETSRRMRNLLGLFVAGTLYFTLVYHLTNAYFAAPGRLRTLHPGRRRDLSGAVLVGLRGRRAHSCRWCSSTTRACVPTRHPGRLGAGAGRRVRAALRLYHRRPGLAAGHLPRLRRREQLRRRTDRAVRAAGARAPAGSWRARRGVPGHAHRRAGAAVPARGRSTTRRSRRAKR